MWWRPPTPLWRLSDTVLKAVEVDYNTVVFLLRRQHVGLDRARAVFLHKIKQDIDPLVLPPFFRVRGE